MKYEEIPHIEILEKEYATKEEIMQFLNVSMSVFHRMKLPIENGGVRGQKALYSIEKLKQKIGNRIEVFLDCEYIKDFPNYIIDKIGNVYLVKGKIIPYKLKHKIDRYGYPIVAPVGENGKKHIPVHKIVAMTYIPNPIGLPQVNHIDGDKLNNSVENLEWCTVQYNTQHAYDKGLNATGIKNIKASPVIAYKNSGEIDAIFETCISCGEHYGISDATVRFSHYRKAKRGVHGYYFRMITKEEFYNMKENELYEQYFFEHHHTSKCNANLRCVT